MMKSKAIIPHFLTTLNLISGLLAIGLSFNDELFAACLLIFLGAIFDLSDGPIARAMKIDSEFGKQLDSLADIITFGVATSAILYNSIFFKIGFLGILLSALPTILGAYRLANYNIIPKKELSFTGLPIPAASMTLVSLYISFLNAPDAYYKNFEYFSIAIIILISFLMISKIKFFNIKEFFPHNNKFQFYSSIVFSIILILWIIFSQGKIVFLIFILYVITSIGFHFLSKNNSSESKK